jgi:glycosyltransferase involved in cell wall biosynthesis
VVLVVEQLRRPVPGGIGTYATGILQGLASMDAPAVPPVVLAASRPTTSPDPLEGWGLPLRTSRLASRELTLLWDLGLSGPGRAGEIVHAVSLQAPPRPRAGSTAAESTGSLVVTVHDLAWRRFPETATSRGRRWHEAALHRALRRADAFVVPSALTAEDLSEAGAGARPVVRIPHGCDHLSAPDGEGASILLDRIGVDRPFFLSVGTLEPRKNLERLVEAYARARGQLAETVSLLVVGPRGWGEQPGRSHVPGVHWVGAVPAGVLADLYGRALAFAYVPLVEGFGLPPLEAMRIGAPTVVSTTVPSVDPDPGGPEVSLRVDPLDVDGIADALVRSATDDVLRAELREQGAAYAAARTWAGAAAAHVALWASLP